MNDLAGKTALVTGSAGGIGLGIARACAEAGMKVVLSDIDEGLLHQSAAELRERGTDVLALRLDVTDRSDWERAARDVPAVIGPVQLLVNNAGVSTNGMRFEEVDPEIWDRVLAVNLTSVYNGVRAFLDRMRGAGGGHIVNTASLAGLVSAPNLAPYVATKFAIVGLSESLRAELAESGIGVSVLCPAGVRSRLWRSAVALRGIPDTETPPDDISGQSARAEMRPEEVGRRVLDAVVADELYIITHPEYRSGIVKRHENLLHAFDRATAFAP